MADSWVEIPSRPFTTSLHSTTSESPTSHPPFSDGPGRRRRGRVVNPSPLHLEVATRTSSVDASSQEEYEESESESDRVMTSSNEGVHSSTSESEAREDAGPEEQQEDDAGTALSVPSDQICFTPQPNAFSHPSSTQSRHRNSVPGSYFPSNSHHGSTQRHSYPGHQQRHSHSPFNATSPNHQADHDAALRASLSTLLSLGAAARGLPKQTQSSTQNRQAAQPSSARVDTTTLRTVPESVALGLDRPSLQPRRVSSTPSSSNRETSPAVESFALQTSQQPDRQKRKAPRSSSKERERQRLAKKPRRLIVDEGVSPTLLTWVVSAGVLVLVSAISFSAGYKVGREGGRLDASLGTTSGGSCAREAGRTGMGLRRLRWGGGTAVRA